MIPINIFLSRGLYICRHKAIDSNLQNHIKLLHISFNSNCSERTKRHGTVTLCEHLLIIHFKKPLLHILIKYFLDPDVAQLLSDIIIVSSHIMTHLHLCWDYLYLVIKCNRTNANESSWSPLFTHKFPLDQILIRTQKKTGRWYACLCIAIYRLVVWDTHNIMLTFQILFKRFFLPLQL